MIRLVYPFAAGLLFGAGLLLSGGANPAVVIGYLDLAGDWDPRLLVMFVGATVVHGPLFRRVARRAQPLHAPAFDHPRTGQLDARLVLGACLFGVGWGLTGLCPGPAFALLAVGRVEPALFVAALLAGMKGVDLLTAAASRRRRTDRRGPVHRLDALAWRKEELQR